MKVNKAFGDGREVGRRGVIPMGTQCLWGVREVKWQRIWSWISIRECVQFSTESLRHQILLWCHLRIVERWKNLVLQSPNKVHSVLDLTAHNSSSNFRICWNSMLIFFSKLVRKGEWLEQRAVWMPLSWVRRLFFFGRYFQRHSYSKFWFYWWSP